MYTKPARKLQRFPCRYGETSTLFRNEDSGEMHGLTRVRQFTISEGHLIVRPDQMVEEFKNCIALSSVLLRDIRIRRRCNISFSKWDPENPRKNISARTRKFGMRQNRISETF